MLVQMATDYRKLMQFQMKITIISKLVINNANNAVASCFYSAEICAPIRNRPSPVGPEKSGGKQVRHNIFA